MSDYNFSIVADSEILQKLVEKFPRVKGAQDRGAGVKIGQPTPLSASESLNSPLNIENFQKAFEIVKVIVEVGFPIASFLMQLRSILSEQKAKALFKKLGASTTLTVNGETTDKEIEDYLKS